MTSEHLRLVIVGGSDAGVAAGMRAHQLDPTTRPLVVVADGYPNFSICGLPFYLSGETPDWRDLAHRDHGDLEAAGLQLRLDTRAVAVDAADHPVAVHAPAGAAQVIGSDRLIIGTGAVPARPPIAGLDLPGVHVLHSMDHVFAVHDRLTAASTRRAVSRKCGANRSRWSAVRPARYKGRPSPRAALAVRRASSSSPSERPSLDCRST